MPRILRRPLFVEDLYGIWSFIGADNEAAADLERVRRLLDEPAFAARSAELGQAIRQAGGTDRAVALIDGVLRSAPPGIAHVA